MAQSQLSESWHLDKRVPIAMLAGLLFQGGAFLWWAAGFSTEVRVQIGFHERRLDRLEEVDRRVIDIQDKMLDRLARIEEKGAMQLDALRRIERTLQPPPP